MLIVGGFGAHRRGKHLLAGVLFSLLFIKPNLGAVLALYCLASRQRRMIVGVGLGIALLAGTTLFLGVELWGDYLDTSRRMTRALTGGAVCMWKQHTVYAFWRTALGANAPGLGLLSSR